jgi:hypothetical protein
MPSHGCRNKGATAELLRAVLDAHPEAAARQNHVGSLPLHYLCANEGVTADLVRVVLDAHPEAAAQPYRSSRLPLLPGRARA